MELSTEQQTGYAEHIDKILTDSDLTTVSVKKVRNKLGEIVGKDLSEQKAAVNSLITERFDKITANESSTSQDEPIATKTNGHVKKEKIKREEVESDMPEVEGKPPAKKRKTASAGSDAKLARMLQAEENIRAGRSTRGAAKPKPKAKAKATRKKSKTKVSADDDSDVEMDSNGEAKPKKEVVRKGGFHKEYALSEPLAALTGETQLARPQVVKKIWEHIKKHDLQDPLDKRQIFCDNKMQAVFKQDKVHMFTMNKLLGKHLYELEEGQGEAVKSEKVRDEAPSSEE